METMGWVYEGRFLITNYVTILSGYNMHYLCACGGYMDIFLCIYHLTQHRIFSRGSDSSQETFR